MENAKATPLKRGKARNENICKTIKPQETKPFSNLSSKDTRNKTAWWEQVALCWEKSPWQLLFAWRPQCSQNANYDMGRMDDWLETPKYESICLNLSYHVENSFLVVHRIFFTLTIVQHETIGIKKMYSVREKKETFWPLSADFFSDRTSKNSGSSPHSALLSVSCEESHSCSQLGSPAQTWGLLPSLL